jgi:hypothetical protein
MILLQQAHSRVLEIPQLGKQCFVKKWFSNVSHCEKATFLCKFYLQLEKTATEGCEIIKPAFCKGNCQLFETFNLGVLNVQDHMQPVSVYLCGLHTFL